MLRVESKQGERNIPWHLKLLPGEQGNNFAVVARVLLGKELKKDNV